MSLPSSKAQLQQVKNSLKKNPLQEGDTGCLLSFRWFKKWMQTTGFEKEKIKTDVTLTKIDNSHLLLGKEILPTIQDHYDYFLLDENTYDLFISWYGGGPKIKVPIVLDPETNLPVPVIVQWKLTVCYQDHNYVIDTNRYEKVKTIKQKACELAGIDPQRARLRDYWNKNIMNLLTDEEKYLYQIHIINTQEILLEVKDDQGNWPTAEKKKRSFLQRTNSSMHSGIIRPPTMTRKTDGLVGLSNLGNTCYFNSAVQCLIHTDLLAAYFDSGVWREQLNVDSRLGTGGVLANLFAQIENDIWTKNIKVITPTKLRETIGKFYKRFSGNVQHDAQELLLCFLDALSEDLNRVHEKHFCIESLSGDGTNDNEIADEAWKRHKAVQDSAIVDIFHGQLKTEICCKVCGNKIVVFDPYASISVPIQQEQLYSIRYCMIMYDPKKQRSMVKILVPEDQEFRAILEDASERFKIPINQLIIFRRDNLVRDFRTSLPNSLRKAEYIVFELSQPPKKNQISVILNSKDDDKSEESQSEEEETSNEQKIQSNDVSDGVEVRYIIGSIMLQNPKNPKQSFALDSPILLECPDEEDDLLEIATERVNYIWEKSQYPTTDKNRALEEKAMKIPQSNWKPKEKLRVSLNFKNYITDSDESIPCLSSQSLKISINPLIAREKLGFNWGALCPIDHTYDTTAPCNEKKLDLEYCFKQLTLQDDLDKFNQWFCPTCKKFVRATASLSIWSVPDVLIIHLKRFVEREGIFKKLTTFVDIPINLNMTKFITGPQKLAEDEREHEYKLYAIINHLGILEGGHYTANIFNDKLNNWYTFNDENVYQTSKNSIISEAAYVLMYKRVPTIQEPQKN